MILVDTSVWIDYYRGIATPETERFHALLDTKTLAVGDLIMVEVLQGFSGDRDFDLARRLFSALTMIDIGGTEIAVQAAHNYRDLRSLGITVRKTIDTLIATRCILDGHALLFSDRDFDPFVAHLGLRDAMAE